jgi:hypothetical protein
MYRLVADRKGWPVLRREELIVDLFAGGGGASQGIFAA